MVVRLSRNKDKYISAHIMIFCKLFAEEHKTSTSVAPENNLESTHNQHPLYLSWLLHVLCYSCCYFISIPMHIAAVGQQKAIKSPSTNICRRLPLRNNDDRSLPPDRNIARRRSNAATATYRWTLGLPTLPTWSRLNADIADLESANCRHSADFSVGISRLGVGNFTRGLSIYFWRERDLPETAMAIQLGWDFGGYNLKVFYYLGGLII